MLEYTVMPTTARYPGTPKAQTPFIHMGSMTTSTPSQDNLLLPQPLSDSNAGIHDCSPKEEKTRSKCINYPSRTHSTMHLRGQDIFFLVSAFLRYGCLTLVPKNQTQALLSYASSSNKGTKTNFKSTKILLWN